MRLRFAFADGEAVAMIGPNGAGKSTLFDAITGLLPPTAGRVYFEGSDITAMPPHRRAWWGWRARSKRRASSRR